MIKFSCVIIDDEPIALALLVACINRIPNFSLVKSYSDSILAAQEIKAMKRNIDFAFIDVEMPKLNGLALAGEIEHNVVNIVLVSAYLLYSIEGYNIKAKHFIHKPFTFEKVEETIKGIIENMTKEKPYIMVNLGRKMQVKKIYVDEIIVVEGNGNYIKIHTVNGTLVSYYKLSKMEHDLKLYIYMKRISRSYIISTKHIEKIDGFTIFLKNGF